MVREGSGIRQEDAWTKWQKFVAGTPCRGDELQKPTHEGHVPAPARWADVGRSAHLKRHGGAVLPREYKSRFVWKRRTRGKQRIDGVTNSRRGGTASCVQRRSCEQDTFEHGRHIQCILRRRRSTELCFFDPEYEDGETLIVACVPKMDHELWSNVL